MPAEPEREVSLMQLSLLMSYSCPLGLFGEAQQGFSCVSQLLCGTAARKAPVPTVMCLWLLPKVYSMREATSTWKLDFPTAAVYIPAAVLHIPGVLSSRSFLWDFPSTSVTLCFQCRVTVQELHFKWICSVHKSKRQRSFPTQHLI